MDNETDTEAEAAQDDCEEAMRNLRDAIRMARTAKSNPRINSRSLSEALTCMETAYLWLRHVPANEVVL